MRSTRGGGGSELNGEVGSQTKIARDRTSRAMRRRKERILLSIVRSAAHSCLNFLSCKECWSCRSGLLHSEHEQDLPM